MGEYAEAMRDVRIAQRMLQAEERAESLAAANESRGRVRAILARYHAERLLEIAVHNNGHHWQGKLRGKVIAEWWPSTGRLIVLGRRNESLVTEDAVLFAHVCVVIAEGNLS